MDHFARRPLRGIDVTLRAAAVTALLLLSATLMRDVLLIVFAAILGACVLRGSATWLHSRSGLGTGWCLALVIVLITVLFGGALWLRGPSIADQAATVADTVSQQVQHLWGNLQNSPLVQRLMPRLKDQAGSVLESLSSIVPGLEHFHGDWK